MDNQVEERREGSTVVVHIADLGVINSGIIVFVVVVNRVVLISDNLWWRFARGASFTQLYREFSILQWPANEGCVVD